MLPICSGLRRRDSTGPLRAGVIPHGRRRISPELGHEPGANVIQVEVAAKAQLLKLNLVGPKEFARPTHRVVNRLVEVVGISHVDPDFRSKEFRIEGYVFVTRVAV